MNKTVEEHNQELHIQFEEVAPGLFVVPNKHKWTLESLIETIKRCARNRRVK